MKRLKMETIIRPLTGYLQNYILTEFVNKPLLFYFQLLLHLFKMKAIVVKNGYIGKQPVIRLEFPYDYDLKELVKSYPGCQWDVKQKVWTVPYTADQLNTMLRFFRGKAWLDYSGLEILKPSPSYPELPPLTERTIGAA